MYIYLIMEYYTLEQLQSQYAALYYENQTLNAQTTERERKMTQQITDLQKIVSHREQREAESTNHLKDEIKALNKDLEISNAKTVEVTADKHRLKCINGSLKKQLERERKRTSYQPNRAAKLYIGSRYNRYSNSNSNSNSRRNVRLYTDKKY
jgi:hypothetical protein